jgi:hypothetical protein
MNYSNENHAVSVDSESNANSQRALSLIRAYMNAQMEQQIVADLRKLDDFRLKEVLDFIAWISRKKPEKRPDLKDTPPPALWPPEIMAFQGIPDLPPFESYRGELRLPQADPLA